MDEEDFKSKYLKRLNEELGGPSAREVSTHEYEEFKEEYLPRQMTLYEKLCKASGRILRVSPGKESSIKMQKALDITHLQITPTDVVSFSILAPMFFILVASTLGFALPFLIDPSSGGSIFMALFAVIGGLVMIIPLQRVPYFLSNNWRMKASNQMVLAVFYIVTYMRHTSNLELAVDFAAEHLSPPLSLDLKKVIWDIETGKYDSLKESLNFYLDTWQEWNKEFIESIHLIESSLYENAESRRLDALDKALSVMLDETYEKMLHYAHDLKSPLQALHMLGVVLPILGLVILPLMVSFVPEVQWYHMMVIYNVILPFSVYYMGKNILSKRPTGYGETKMEDDKRFKKYRNIVFKFLGIEVQMNPFWFCAVLFLGLLFIGLLPLILHFLAPEFDIILGQNGVSTIRGTYTSEDASFYFLGYRNLILDGEIRDVFVGPFGLGATMLSLFIPLALGLSFGIFYRIRSNKLVEIRKEAKELEQEFAAALFQLGNRLGDGIPAEMAFSKVAETMEDTTSGKFFQLVSINIRKLGMGLEDAIFDREKGALAYYPSNLIESSMKVLVQASRKGPLVASQALMNVAEYIKQMHRVDERLRDLMADIVSDMKAQISFLTPAIAGIVVGITSMITKILGSLGENMARLQADASASQSGALGPSLLSLFGTGIPTYWFQAIVGVYVVQVVFILTMLVNGIENGVDKLMERNSMGKFLVRTTVTYVIIAGVIMLLFNLIAGSIIQPLTGA